MGNIEKYHLVYSECYSLYSEVSNPPISSLSPTHLFYPSMYFGWKAQAVTTSSSLFSGASDSDSDSDSDPSSSPRRKRYNNNPSNLHTAPAIPNLIRRENVETLEFHETVRTSVRRIVEGYAEAVKRTIFSIRTTLSPLRTGVLLNGQTYERRRA